MISEQQKLKAEIIHKWAVVLAILVGGIWTLIVFVITPSAYVQASHKVDIVKLKDQRNFIRVRVRLHNKGSGKQIYKKGSYVYVEVNSLSPSLKQLEQLKDGDPEFIQQRSKGGTFEFIDTSITALDDWSPIKPTIYQDYYFNYIIPSHIQAVSVYSEVKQNPDGEPGKNPKNEILLHKPVYSTHVLSD